MAAKIESVFGGLTLTGADAEAFRERIKAPRPNPAAAEALRRGRELAARKRDGRILVTVNKPC